MELPIGFDNEVGGERMTIGIVGMSFTPERAFLNAVFSYPLPQLGPNIGIGLGARGVCFAPTGLGGDGRRELYLAADIGFRRDSSWGFRFKAPTISGGVTLDSGTYVSWDCNGFQALRLRADVEFPRDWMLPLDGSGNVDADLNKLVTASFATTVRRGSNWMASATITPFAPASMPDLHFTVESVVIDQSDVENDPAMNFPLGYQGVVTSQWRGFYLKTGRVKLPDALKTFNTGQPPAITLSNVLIDRSGLSGKLAVSNLVPYPQGNLAGWAGGLDTVALEIVSNSFREGRFTGRVGLPISDSGIDYRATFAYSRQTRTPSFTLNLQPRDTLSVSMWVARLALNPTATVTIE
jgi:hypothetical protein